MPPTMDLLDPSQITYLSACRELGVTVSNYVLRHLVTSQIVMKYHNLGAPGTRACAVALVVSSFLLDRKRERQRQRERERKRDRERQRDRQRERERERDRQRNRQRETERDIERQRQRETERHRERKKEREREM